MQFITSHKSEYHQCNIFMAEDLSVLLLPTLFSKAVSRTGVVWKRVTLDGKEKFVSTIYQEEEISDVTITILHNKLEHFFNWLVQYSRHNSLVSIDRHHNIPEELLNHYINTVIIEEQGAGEHTVEQYLIALRDYYNFLAMTGFTNAKDIRVKPRFKSIIKRNTKRRTAVKYLTPELRSILYRNTDSRRDELLLRGGGELGLRSKENQGLLLEDFMVGNKKHLGFKSLFLKMAQHPEQMEFEYFLQGQYTKAPRNTSGGKSRRLFIHRSLLERYKFYYDNERPESAENTLLLNASYGGCGTPIAENAASRAFTRAKKKVLELQRSGALPEHVQMLEDDHTGHILRHSFGTDKFYDACRENRVKIDSVTPTSAVYLLVAKLMGHNAKDGSAPETTKTYIRSCHIKEKFSPGVRYD
ncbi:site-specific integrase [Rheinheimera sp.]|uniref:site-specific integrase n=1 Tax=Rheinheimera sp. TaxID=1869214 RepID=UPI00263788F2|nr:site-specific integrase [Rheinheimera sp.]MCA1931699.1 site-specific integrase [Rheinheimera sp.]